MSAKSRTFVQTNIKKMEISHNRVVALTYELSIKEANDEMEIIEVVDADEPMVFIVGMSGLPEGFENQLIGLKAGDNFEFSVSAEEGYGEFDPEAVVDLPIDIFKIDGEIDREMLEIGNFLPMTDDQGNQMRGKVEAVNEFFVTMNFNHPLADKEMFFKGKVENVREATESELDHGHVHGDGGVIH